MSNTLIINQPQIMAGLGTMTYTIPTTGAYSVQVQLNEVPTSGISILVKDNGSTIFTAPTLGQTQSAQQFKYSFLATAAHTITVVVASSSAVDSVANNVIVTTSIQQGF